MGQNHFWVQKLFFQFKRVCLANKTASTFYPKTHKMALTQHQLVSRFYHNRFHKFLSKIQIFNLPLIVGIPFLHYLNYLPFHPWTEKTWQKINTPKESWLTEFSTSLGRRRRNCDCLEGKIIYACFLFLFVFIVFML